MTQKSPSAHYRTTLSGYIFATKACIGKKFVADSRPTKLCRMFAVFWTGTLYIHTFGGSLLPRDGILPGAKFTLRFSLAH